MTWLAHGNTPHHPTSARWHHRAHHRLVKHSSIYSRNPQGWGLSLLQVAWESITPASCSLCPGCQETRSYWKSIFSSLPSWFLLIILILLGQHFYYKMSQIIFHSRPHIKQQKWNTTSLTWGCCPCEAFPRWVWGRMWPLKPFLNLRALKGHFYLLRSTSTAQVGLSNSFNVPSNGWARPPD